MVAVAGTGEVEAALAAAAVEVAALAVVVQLGWVGSWGHPAGQALMVMEGAAWVASSLAVPAPTPGERRTELACTARP